SMHRHGLGAVLAQMQCTQLVSAAQRVCRITVTAGPQHDALCVPFQHFVPQAHGVLVRDERFDGSARQRHAPAPGKPGFKRAGVACAATGSSAATSSTATPAPAPPPPGARDTSNDSTKLNSTPSATVLPIARSTGMLDSASRL